MPAPSRDSQHALAAWVVLVALTALSWIFVDHGYTGFGVKAGASLVLAVAFIKVFIVGLIFMEHRRAAPALRIAYASWCAVTGTAVIGLYLAQ
ncbi:cytochrome C oxidase subunit IV family protein [Streptomyces sp. NPDC059874]|uniref:cytochrome C oxidase subunit IV family protein n=1 Tax=Streptomyces sp. NPDC059874 TaxID=3346983 RepID=UPI00365E6C33